MNKQTVKAIGVIGALGATGSVLSVLAYKWYRKFRYNTIMEYISYTDTLFDVNEDEFATFYFEDLTEEERVFFDALDQKLGTHSFMNEIADVLATPHVPGNRTTNDLLNRAMQRLSSEDKKKLVAFIDNHKEKFREIYHIREIIDLIDFEDYLDYYNGKGEVIDESVAKKAAKMLELTLSDEEMETYLSMYAY